MSDVENFDDHVRKEFSNYTPNVSPYIWERIVAEREKRRPTGFWFTLFFGNSKLLLTGLILTIVMGGGLFVFHSTSNTINLSGNKPIVAASTNTDSQNKNLSNVGAENNNNNNNNNNNINSIIDFKVGDQKIILVKSNLNRITGNKTISSGEIKSNLSNSKTIQPNVYNKKHTIYHLGKAYLSSSLTQSPATDFDNANKDLAIIENNRRIRGEDKIVNNNRIVSSFDQGQSLNNEENNPENSTENYLHNRFLNGVEKISLSTFSHDISLNQKNTLSVNLPECPTIEKDAAANKHYLEVYIGPDYDIRSLTDTGNSVYLQKRKSSSSFTSGFSAGVRYTRVFINGMSLRGALNYSQINERFSFVQANVVQTTYIIDPNTGDTTGSYTVRGTRYLTTYNHYRSIDIPLTIGYEFGNGKLHTNINAGIIANIYSWQKGNILDTNYQPVDITTGKGSSFYQFKTNVGFGATGGVSFYYKLTDQMHILAEPYMRYNFQPMSTNNLTLREKYTTVGLRLGLRVDLP